MPASLRDTNNSPIILFTFLLGSAKTFSQLYRLEIDCVVFLFYLPCVIHDKQFAKSAECAYSNRTIFSCV